MHWWQIAGVVLAVKVAVAALVLCCSRRARVKFLHPILAKINTRDDWHTRMVKTEARRVRDAARLR